MPEVLLGDAGDGDVFDVHLIAADEVEQKLQRAGIDVELDLVVPALAGLPRRCVRQSVRHLAHAKTIPEWLRKRNRIRGQRMPEANAAHVPQPSSRTPQVQIAAMSMA